jgi:hypothetical protein
MKGGGGQKSGTGAPGCNGGIGGGGVEVNGQLVEGEVDVKVEELDD